MPRSAMIGVVISHVRRHSISATTRTVALAELKEPHPEQYTAFLEAVSNWNIEEFSTLSDGDVRMLEDLLDY